MNNIGWSLWMTLLGMGAVFLMLILLLLLLQLIGRIDTVGGRKAKRAEVESGKKSGGATAAVVGGDTGLSPEQVAAVSVAVLAHAGQRHAGPVQADRTYKPGSRLWASRWVETGRASQMRNTRR